MNPWEYLALTKDLVAELERQLAPHAEELQRAILAAEKRYAEAINTPDEQATYIASRDDGSGVMATLASYMYKWRDMDAENRLDEEVETAQQKYAEASEPLLEAHEIRVKERLNARRNNLSDCR